LKPLEVEQFVYDKLVSGPHWKKFTIEERAHAIKCIDSLGGNTRGIKP